jgi:hypothetical protein
VSDEQDRARIVLESHGRAGGKMRAAIEKARRDTIEEAARWLEEHYDDVPAKYLHERMCAALLGKQAGEAPKCELCSGNRYVIGFDLKPIPCHMCAAPAPAETFTPSAEGPACESVTSEAAKAANALPGGSLSPAPAEGAGEVCGTCGGSGKAGGVLHSVERVGRCGDCSGTGRTPEGGC